MKSAQAYLFVNDALYKSCINKGRTNYVTTQFTYGNSITYRAINNVRTSKCMPFLRKF